MPIYELPGNLTEKIQTRWGEISVSMSDDNEICIFFDPNSSETDEDYFHLEQTLDFDSFPVKYK